MVNALELDNETRLIGLTTDIKGAGQRVDWVLSGSFDPMALDAALTAEGVTEPSLRPELPTACDALKLAMRDFAGKRKLVRPLAHRGQFALVIETVQPTGLKHETKITVEVTPIGTLRFTPPDEDPVLVKHVRQLYEENLLGIGATATGEWLSQRVIPFLDGIRLKERGGDYYVPPTQVDNYRRIKRALASVSRSRLRGMPVLNCEDAVEILLEGLAEQFSSECNQLLNELNALGERALETRKNKLEALRQKVARYEATLGQKMPALHEQAEEADGIIVAAMLAAAPQMKEAGKRLAG